MTLRELQDISKFGELFRDPRFIAAIQYLREHPAPRRANPIDATSIIKNEGAWCGWFDFARELEDLATPVAPAGQVEKGRPYQPPAPK